MKRISFGTDGWRGVIADEFTFDNVRIVTHAISLFLKQDDTYEKGVLVGYDTRFLSDRFARAAVEVLAGNGIRTLISSGPVPTPVVSFQVMNMNLAGGIMLTASHNPYWYNGLKFKPSYGGSATTQITSRIEALANEISRSSREVPRIDWEQAFSNGLVAQVDLWPEYEQKLRSLVDFSLISNAKYRVAVDTLHGASTGYLDRAFDLAGCEVESLSTGYNPAFGGVNPEPIPPNINRLIERMKTGKYDIGLASDGDGDRIGMVDSDGNFVNPHRILALTAMHLAKNKKMKGAIVRTISTTSMADVIARKYGLKLYETPVGFKYISELMLKDDVLIGGEESGGIGVKGHCPERDAILAALLVAEMMALEGKSLSELIDELFSDLGQPYYYGRRDVHLSSSDQNRVMDGLRASPPQRIAGRSIAEVKQLDGIKLILQDGSWLLLRPSGTEPLIRIYAEASRQDLVTELLDQGEGFLKDRASSWAH